MASPLNASCLLLQLISKLRHSGAPRCDARDFLGDGDRGGAGAAARRSLELDHSMISGASQNRWWRMCILMGATIAIPLIVIPAFTGALDPYGLYGGIVDRQAPRLARTQNDRLIKPWDIIIQQPRTILFGTSRVKEGFRPDWFPDAYNAGIDGAGMADIADMVDHAAHFDRALHTAYIELPFSSFVGGAPPRPPPPLVTLAGLADGLVKFFLSMQAVEASLSMLGNPPKPDYYITRGGFADAPGKPPESTAEITTDYLAAYPKFAWAFTMPNEFAWLQFARIQLTCTEHRIKCVFFATPSSAPVLAAIDLHGDWPIFTDYKRRLAAQGAIFDFDDPNGKFFEIGKPVYWHNSGHFAPALANPIAREMVDGHAVVLTPENVGSRLRELHAALRHWEIATGFAEAYRRAFAVSSHSLGEEPTVKAGANMATR